MFLDDMIDDTFMIINFSVIRAGIFLVGWRRYLSLHLMQLLHVHLVLLSHLLAEDVNLIESLLQLRF